MAAMLKEVHPVLAVRDVEGSLAFYAKLGFSLSFTDASSNAAYVGIRRDAVELHLQWHAEADFEKGNRPVYRFVVDDVDALSAEFEGAGMALDRTEVNDTPWGTREFHVRDPDGNGLQFYRDL